MKILLNADCTLLEYTCTHSLSLSKTIVTQYLVFMLHFDLVFDKKVQ